MMNMYWEPLTFALPQISGYGWWRSLDTVLPSPQDVVPLGEEVAVAGDTYTVADRSIVILESKPY